MIVAIDESGRLESEKGNDVCLTTLVCVTDKGLEEFRRFFIDEFGNGWPNLKGSGLKPDRLEEVLQQIGRQSTDIRYYSLVNDTANSSVAAVKEHQKQEVAEIEVGLKTVKLDETKREIEAYARWVDRLKRSDYIRYSLVSYTLFAWPFRFGEDYKGCPVNRDSWEVQIIIDQLPGYPKEILELLKMNIKYGAYLKSGRGKVMIPKGWWHPFLRQYLTSRLNRLKLYENMRLGDDKKDLCLKLPDIIGNAIYKSISRSGEDKYFRLPTLIKDNRSENIGAGQAYMKGGYYEISATSVDARSTTPSERLLEHHRKLTSVVP